MNTKPTSACGSTSCRASRGSARPFRPTPTEQHVGRIEIRRWRSDFPRGRSGRRRDRGVRLRIARKLHCGDGSAGPWPRCGSTWNTSVRKPGSRAAIGCRRCGRNGRWTKYFFFPGFTPRTGGLLRERDLLADRAAFDSAAEAEFWQSVGVPARSDRELRVSMFCYENASLPDLLQCWAEWPGRRDRAGNAGTSRRSGSRLVRRAAVARDAAAAVIADGLRTAVPAAIELRPAAVGMRREFRARRGFVRAGPMGRAAVCVADLSPGGRGASGQAGGVLESISRAVRDKPPWCGGAGRPGMAGAISPRPGPISPPSDKAIEQHGKVWASRLDQTGDLSRQSSLFRARDRSQSLIDADAKLPRIRVAQERNLKMGIVTAGELSPATSLWSRKVRWW